MYQPIYDRRAEREVTRSFIKVAAGISLLLVAGFYQAVTWDQYFFEIIPLKAKLTIGGMTPDNYARLADICKIRKNLDCVETALAGLATSDASHIEALATLGGVQANRHEFKQAANTFAIYFKNGGQSPDAAYDYARSLAEIGLIDQAAQYYQAVLKAKPDTMQITVTQDYVKMLVAHGRLADAKSLIQGIRAKGGNASMFMEDEMQKIAKATEVSKN
jgi:hypothetical protein